MQQIRQDYLSLVTSRQVVGKCWLPYPVIVVATNGDVDAINAL